MNPGARPGQAVPGQAQPANPGTLGTGAETFTVGVLTSSTSP